MPDLKLIVKGIPKEAEGPVMLHIEKVLRQMGYSAEVYKETKPDDSKLRSLMTVEQRAKL